jgi:DNA-binding SARP family transcriptional activator
MTATSVEPGRPTGPPPGIHLRLIEGFELDVDGAPVVAPFAVQRLIAFLALHPRPLHRTYVAGSLWLDKTEARATSNLRSALWRTHACGRRLIHCSRTHLRLGDEVRVDVTEADSTAHRLLSTGVTGVDVDARLLGGELLPDWYDDWVIIERERLRQLCLTALERASAGWLVAGRLGLAVEAAYRAVSAEPLRESANRAVVEAHLAAGNVKEAVDHYTQYRKLLREALGLTPSAVFDSRVRHAVDTVNVVRR